MPGASEEVKVWGGMRLMALQETPVVCESAEVQLARDPSILAL